VTIRPFNESAGGQVMFHPHADVISRFNGQLQRPPLGQVESSDLLADRDGQAMACSDTLCYVIS
jgi:histidine triad (HIT) family protein